MKELIKIKNLFDSGKVVHYLKSQAFPAGTVLRVGNIIGIIQHMINNNQIKFDTTSTDVSKVVRGAFSGLVKSGCLLKINPDKKDGLYEVIVPSDEWLRL